MRVHEVRASAPRPDGTREQRAVRGVLATPHSLATAAGAEAYRAGGNAIDAALAAAAVLAVVYPHQCSIGGDLFALVHPARGTSRSVNGSGASPGGTTAAALRKRYAEIPESGPDSITVPGAVAAWGTLHELGATLPFERLLGPAIQAAAEGVPVVRSLEYGIRFRAAALVKDAGMRTTFLPNGEPLRTGARLRQSALARTLETLAREGAQDFYTGAIARRLVTGLTQVGCPLTGADLAQHRSLVDEPLSLARGDHEILTSPPNSQGFVLLEALAALDAAGIPVDALGADAAYLLSSLLLAAGDRERYLGDPRRSALPLAQLASPARLAARLRERCAQGTAPSGAMAPSPAHGDTVAVCALDCEGRAVSLIQSVYQTFGAAIMDGETGIILHNRARGFSLTPGAANEWAPAERPAHTLMPLLVQRAGHITASLGTMGGRAQPQILAQLLPGVLDPQQSLANVLRAPRWVFGARDLDFNQPTIAIEADAPQQLDVVLRMPGLDTVRIPAVDERVGHAQLARVASDGALEAASDPRSDGAAEVVVT
jgi:oxamate amidohydrolase